MSVETMPAITHATLVKYLNFFIPLVSGYTGEKKKNNLFLRASANWLIWKTKIEKLFYDTFLAANFLAIYQVPLDWPGPAFLSASWTPVLFPAIVMLTNDINGNFLIK